MASRVRKLHDFGQAPWLDFVDRRFLKEGGLQRLVEEDGVTGVTSIRPSSRRRSRMAMPTTRSSWLFSRADPARASPKPMRRSRFRTSKTRPTRCSRSMSG
jgi:hypothetical protein